MLKKAALVIVISALLIGCGSGSDPFGDGGDQTITINTDQDQTNTQTQNEPEVECTRSCSLELDGGSNLTENCKGGASSVLAAYASFNECAAQVSTTEIGGE